MVWGCYCIRFNSNEYLNDTHHVEDHECNLNQTKNGKRNESTSICKCRHRSTCKSSKGKDRMDRGIRSWDQNFINKEKKKGEKEWEKENLNI